VDPAYPNGASTDTVGVASRPNGVAAPSNGVVDGAALDEGLDYRRRYRGLIGVHSKVPIRDRAILSLIYTPGVAEACLAINADPLSSFDLTCRGNTVAFLTDGSTSSGASRPPPPRPPCRSPRARASSSRPSPGSTPSRSA
jgi:hypothetical protein